ncbi:class I SAM-dependent methyltransferase [Mesorhizobium australafricanum]|uniref:Methyltransferase domain-containing protein n=1 Tax=Mesorhizobium australafricanum TaxID=3072311 RepID=A0ABU4X5N2_9HYPH|nr:methyltransferase domain-containing protein [Mesorhizobium sp. VK3E]MDX8443640.1 methyltransferase domain-containing protein [Mesorhizobium sp. VK3E]
MAHEFEFGENWASIYEQFTSVRGRVAEAAETAAFLERYARGGSAFELGIGDGRVAVPLSERDVRVEGIDNSESMLKLLAKRTDQIKAWKEDIADFRSEQRYDLVYCVYSTFTLLFTRDAQVACLRCAAEALDSEGILVLELGVPALDGFIRGQRTSTLFVDHDNTILNSDVHDPLNQTLVSTLLWFSATSMTRTPHRTRYVYHQELDSMAECAGLELAERWGSWTRSAFTDSCKRHISVYRRKGLRSRRTFEGAEDG